MLSRPTQTITMIYAIMFGLLTMLSKTGADAGQKVLLKDVTSLVFTKGELTTGRRSAPVSQLVCDSERAVCRYEPSSIGCKNTGWDGNDVVWQCEVTGGLPSNVKLGKMKVSCEGYEYPDDPYILKGSCGLIYKLERTGDEPESYRYKQNYESTNSGGDVIGGILFMVFIFMIISCMCQDSSSSSSYYRRRSSDYGYGTGLAHGYLASSLVNSGSSWGSRGYSSSSSSWGGGGSSWGSGNSSGFATTSRR